MKHAWTSPPNLNGALSDRSKRIGIVASRFNESINRGLLNGALSILEKAGIANESVLMQWVPGALELPLAAKRMIERQQVNAVIAIGTVIQGETDHHEHVGREAISGLSQLSLSHDIPIGVGILTVKNLDQAIARSSHDDENRGMHAAAAVVELLLQENDNAAR